ncbi:S41 family peptidase [Fulvivirga sp. 29W222]|uniref:S41 family peptidase n=1 Tax=Fulvivirga marina TaxID=2494733 RepID=A0A937FXA5_9BACT|nr:S41 family peptidase [Fulvivirga marina]MBL6447804.1 S41 family peptidase [Fulvivirga marina]
MKQLTFLFVLIATTTLAQEKTYYSQVMDTVVDKTINYYILPDVAKQLKNELSGIANNAFDGLSKEQFADTVTSILRVQGDDKHFTLLYRPNFLKQATSKEEQQAKFNEINRRWNYGFESVRRLPGNVGYISYSGFAESNSSNETLAAAMNFVANTNSLILDLRDNRGGDETMLLLFCSYFFDKEITLSKKYSRYDNKTIINKTQSDVTGQKYTGKPVYILTSKSSFSAAEAISYHLKHNGIATIIGETTAGAANPVDMFIINDEFLFFVPVGEITDLTTQKNWEHTGVKPHFNISADKALEKAQVVALEHILKEKIVTELSEEELAKEIDGLKEKLEL